MTNGQNITSLARSTHVTSRKPNPPLRTPSENTRRGGQWLKLRRWGLCPKRRSLSHCPTRRVFSDGVQRGGLGLRDVTCVLLAKDVIFSPFVNFFIFIIYCGFNSNLISTIQHKQVLFVLRPVFLVYLDFIIIFFYINCVGMNFRLLHGYFVYLVSLLYLQLYFLIYLYNLFNVPLFIIYFFLFFRTT